MAENEAGAHPVWACDNEAIKAEYRRALDDGWKYLSMFQRADSEAERLHFALENLVGALNRLEPWPEGAALARLNTAFDTAVEVLSPIQGDEGEHDGR